MAKVGKDDFVNGFVPHHNHGSVDYTSMEAGHVHHYKAHSGPAIPVGNGQHVHYYDFYTTENDGHRHHVKGTDQPAPGNK